MGREERDDILSCSVTGPPEPSRTFLFKMSSVPRLREAAPDLHCPAQGSRASMAIELL